MVGARLVAPGADPADPAAEHSAAVRARRAIVAMPPVLCGAPRLVAAAARAPRPAVPAHAHGRRSPRSTCIYERPFWRDEGLNGQVVAPTAAPCAAPSTTRPPDASHGAIVGFVAGDECRRLERAGPEARPGRSLADLERAFGPGGRTPVEVVEQHWPAEPYTRGGPVAVSVPGALTGFGPALREPVGPLHWAGTETATEWCGYLDGALSSGIAGRRRGAAPRSEGTSPVGLD